MIINIGLSISFFKKYGFIIIPIATSISTWFSVLIYFYLLQRNKFLNFNNKITSNFIKIVFSTLFMSIFLIFSLKYFEDKFQYDYDFKLIYLLIVVSFSASIYLLMTKFFGILNFKSYKSKMSKSLKKLVFSGVQPTGNLHLGNYLGAIKNFVDLQKKMECIYCVVDLHAITVFNTPKELKENILDTTATFLACGLDLQKKYNFNQSSVSGHSELAWILNCISRVGWMNRMTQFKEKAGSNKENASVGICLSKLNGCRYLVVQSNSRTSG